MLIQNLKIRKIFATNSLPTIEIELKTRRGSVISSVPIGTSAGKHEAVYFPTDVAMRKFAILCRHFRTQSFDSPADVDDMIHILDKTPNFNEIGGNLAVGLSSAFLKAFALESGKELFEYIYEYTKQKKLKTPLPISNVVGGWHGQSDIQEFLLLPVIQKSFLNSSISISEAYFSIRDKLKKEDRTFAYGKNLESAWITGLDHEDVLKILTPLASEKLLKIGLDVAASSLWDGRHYVYKNDRLIQTEQLGFITELVDMFPIVYIEDPFEEDEFVFHSTLTHRLSDRNIMVCGDDLYVTNLQRLRQGIEYKSTNTVLVKPNQVGTITDTIKFVEEAKKHGMRTVISHRSGETEDTLICHLVFGLGCDYIKLGASGERTTKINEMIRIEEKISTHR